MVYSISTQLGEKILVVFILMFFTRQTCNNGNNHCYICSERWKCGTCYPGYSLVQGIFSRYCTMCSDQNCAECPLDVNICTACAEHYRLNNGNC